MLVSSGLFAVAEDGLVASPRRVLDLYAGSGALGLEALSRGASSVVMVESARPALQAIRENVSSLQVEDQVTLLSTQVERALTTLLNEAESDPEKRFDLIVVDPPYAEVRSKTFERDVLEKSARLLAAAGIFVLEHSSEDEPLVPGLHLDRRRRYGDTTLSLFVSEERGEEAEPEDDAEDSLA